MGRKLQILVVEDDARDAALLLRELQRGGLEVDFDRVDNAEDMNRALDRTTFDVIISDYSMPRFSANAALALVGERNLDVPVIIVSGTVTEDVAVETMRAGAVDFMAKGRLMRLIPAIKRELQEAASRAEKKEIERQLRHSQKMESIGQLTGGIAHDFNNLLAVIVGNIEVLLEMLADEPLQKELAEASLASALRGADLTKRLLTFARQQPVSVELVELNKRLPDLTTMLRRTLGASIQVNVKLAEDLWPVMADASRIEDALINLSINARDAMPNGGTLTIETANAQLDEDYVGLHPGLAAGDYMVLSVTDTGTGMSPETLERATEPFFTTKEHGKGTGLGLSMVYSFARQSNGHLNIYSELGVGTTIRLYLPRAQKPAAAAEVTQATKIEAGGGERILLVDDNADLRRVALRQLISLGYQPREAASGPEALSILETGERFDLLFTDIGLPEGMTGLELARRAHLMQPWLKVLFTTGYGNVAGAQGEEEAEPLLRKPYRAQELAEKIRATLKT